MDGWAALAEQQLQRSDKLCDDVSELEMLRESSDSEADDGRGSPTVPASPQTSDVLLLQGRFSGLLLESVVVCALAGPRAEGLSSLSSVAEAWYVFVIKRASRHVLAGGELLKRSISVSSACSGACAEVAALQARQC